MYDLTLIDFKVVIIMFVLAVIRRFVCYFLERSQSRIVCSIAEQQYLQGAGKCVIDTLLNLVEDNPIT